MLFKEECTWQGMKCAPIFAHGWFERKSECRDSGKQAIHNLWITQTFFLASNSLRTDQETKDVVQDWLKGLLLRHFICTLYFCFNIELYIVLNFVTFSCSANSTGFILIGIPEVSLFLNGPIILSDMTYLNPYLFITLTQDGIESIIHIISST